MVQWIANPIRKKGGGVSGSWCMNLIKGNNGPTTIILTGERMVEMTDFQCCCESEPVNASGACSNNKVLTSRNANAKTRKRKTNFALDTFIVPKN